MLKNVRRSYCSLCLFKPAIVEAALTCMVTPVAFQPTTDFCKPGSAWTRKRERRKAQAAPRVERSKTSELKNCTRKVQN